MARKENIGARKPMSDETKLKIAESVSRKAKERREELELLKPKAIIKKKKKVEMVQMQNQKFDPSLFVPMSTGKLIDHLFTFEGGLPKATNYIIVGDPASGKTTVCVDMLSDLVANGYKCLFVSAEMTRIDMYKYVQRFPKFGKIDILFLNEYYDDDPKRIIEEVLQKSYDVVLIDSFVEVQSAVSEYNKMTMKSTEKWLVDIMISNNMGNNIDNKNTMFIAIQQVTKEGVFLGSNKLKHNTTGMLELRFENIDDPNNSSSYLFFSKNRRGKAGPRLYFSLQNGEDVEYSVNRIMKNQEEVHGIGDLEKLSKGTTIELDPEKTNPFEIV